MKLRLLKLMLVFIATLTLCSCADVSVAKRVNTAEQLLEQASWHQHDMLMSALPIRAYLPALSTTKELTVYIEGDGLAWLNRRQPSMDPTPINPLALKLALADPYNTAVYLARPCQYVKNEHCQQRHWTSGRFSNDVVTAMNLAVSHLKSAFGADQIQLIGYSGGGAIAALIAARRDDVIRLITVAGNLNHDKWTQLHTITPLTHSLNPADYSSKLQPIRQVHFVGADDQIVPLAVAKSFQDKFPTASRPEIKLIKSAKHHCCWFEQWSLLLESIE